MAKKKMTRAEKVAGSSSKKSKQNETASKKSKNTETVETAENKQPIPARVISSIIFACLFVTFLILAFKSDGTIPSAIYGLINGLIGKIGFIFSIPAFLYLFVIHAFSGKRPVCMRSVCVGIFVLCCGCLSHLGSGYILPDSFVETIRTLYEGGIDGASGGVLCGSIAIAMEFLFAGIFSYIILFISALLTLLGAMQITIPSIIRAIENRPRPQEEKEEPKPEPQEPAAVVVNHFTNARIAYKERQRAAQQAQAEEIVPEQETNKAKNIFSQIESDVEAPVSAAEASFRVTGESDIMTGDDDLDPVIIGFDHKKSQATSYDETDESSSKQMPELILENANDIPQKVTAQEAQESAEQVAVEIAQAETNEKPEYVFPPISLLKRPRSGGGDGTLEMQENAQRLNDTLASFKIEAHIINVTRGPSVTRYEVELEKGVRLGKLTSAADDIALSLGASGVRIAAVPGKISVVGIEVPNQAVTTVSLREVIDSDAFVNSNSKSAFAVGKDISGNSIVGNIAKLPHMLIAGTTGSGKSVCMNSIIISLLYKASPEDVKLIMVDPKMVELGIYNGIPHLLIPVVTDPKKAAGSLQWAVSEMLRRYKAMSDAGVRDLESYNSIIESQEVEGKKLPQVVVIIDELADLMLVAAKEVEESICRIAQMGRASGIHLVIATQRPSADVITGLMKANIPSRIAFAVASAMESRIILDTQGAEKLVGKGDMLFAPIGQGKPKRVQGCFVSDAEVEAVVNHVKSNFSSNYDQQVMEDIERKATQQGSKTPATASDPDPASNADMGDEMLPAAVEVILETGQASVSMLQRRLKLGYARAARIVDEMEEKKIVGPFQGSKPRAILITKEQWNAMQSGQTAQMNFDDLPDSASEEDDSEGIE